MIPKRIVELVKELISAARTNGWEMDQGSGPIVDEAARTESEAREALLKAISRRIKKPQS